MPATRNHKIKRYGWIPDLPDHRDSLYAAPIPLLQQIPPKVDLRSQFPVPAYDQGELGSCTANAIAGAIQFAQIKENAKQFTPSRLFIYYNERVIEGTVPYDSGAQIRDGMKSVSTIGACPETDWPYAIDKFANKPQDPPSYKDAPLGKVMLYKRVVHNLAQMRACLASGFPFVFGFTVYESFETEQVAKTGEVPMPAAGEQVVGGHAVLAVGYDDPTQRFIVRNSWGTDWGIKGHFTMPYAYLAQGDLADDFWTVRLVAKQEGLAA
jgi:C1A family cysteine protease